METLVWILFTLNVILALVLIVATGSMRLKIDLLKVDVSYWKDMYNIRKDYSIELQGIINNLRDEESSYYKEIQ